MIALMARGWPVFVVAVVGNAVVQSATAAPFATPSTALAFVALALVSASSCGAALIVIVAEVRASASGARRSRPRWAEGAAAFAVVLAVALAGLASLWLVPPAMTIALGVLAGVASGDGSAAFAAFRRTPLGAAALALTTLLLVGLLWIGALLLGFFVTGWLAAALTWLAFGALGTALLSAWTSLVMRPSLFDSTEGV